MDNFLNPLNWRANNVVQFSKALIALWIFLLIFEGALRKWILPGLATPLLLVREPIAIILVLIGFQRGWLNSMYCVIMVVAAILSFIATFIFGHGVFTVALYGLRIYLLNFPLIFIMGHLLTRDDLLDIFRFFLYVSVPMSVLIGFQFYLPQEHWVNVGLGGEGSAGFSGAMGHFRPPGTFSFISGLSCFFGFVACCLMCYLMMNYSLIKEKKISTIWLVIMSVAMLYAIPTSISRGLFFGVIVTVIFVGFAAIRERRMGVKFFNVLFFVGLAIVVIVALGVGNESIEAFTARYESAASAEGGGEGTRGVIMNRGLDGYFNFFGHNFDMPFFGYGMGLGTNAGAFLLGGNIYSFGFNAEGEFGRVFGESGILFGFTIILVRFTFSLSLLIKSYFLMVKRLDIVPWILCSVSFLGVFSSQWGIPTNLGFAILGGGLTLAAVNTSPPIKKRKQQTFSNTLA